LIPGIASRRKFQALCLLAALAVAGRAGAQVGAQNDAPSDFFRLTADAIDTFTESGQQVVHVPGRVTIETDRAKFTADSAVIWFVPVEGSALKRQRAEIALVGNARIEQGQVVRSGDRLLVSSVIGGPIRLTVENRRVSEPLQTDLYKLASDMRPLTFAGPARGGNGTLIQRPWLEPQMPPATRPATRPFVPKAPVTFTAADVQTTTQTPDGKIAAVLKGGVVLLQRRPNGDLIELQAQQVVLFTTVDDFNALGGNVARLSDAVTGAYLEGDVRINFTPNVGGRGPAAENRLSAERVFYEFETDRAVLTDVVLQATDPRVPLPVTMRAAAVKQLALGEYKAENVTLTTSQFATPSYSVNATHAYVRQYTQGDRLGMRTQFDADNATFRAYGVPFFYLPTAFGEVTERGIPLRELAFGGTRSFGAGIQTRWGLFETIGAEPPPGLDASYRLDYYSDRGPGFGFDADYQGGFVTDTTRQPWNFLGNFTAYGTIDDGQDNLGRERVRIQHDDDFRGRVRYEHQHFLPDGWQVQLRGGYTSDATFLEEWFERDFNEGLPTNLSAYLKKQTDTEAITFLLEYQPSGVVTTADALQERFDSGTGNPIDDRPFEVDRLPEVGYYRIGDSFADDRLTLFSENRVGGLRMNEADDPLGSLSDPTRDNYGFGQSDRRLSSPGIPSAGYTGTTDDYVVRGDLRQEVDWPVDYGAYKLVPYVVGRYTGYSDSPGGGGENRLLAGVGTRLSTAFWNIDDSARSAFWDISRVRHVIEPELNVFASASSTEREDLYIYDQTVDAADANAAVSFFVRQRWQTKRGGPGRFRNSDFLTLNVGVILFADENDEPENPDRAFADARNDDADPNNDFDGLRRLGPRNAEGFRGLYFQSTPEASIPRSSLQADTEWRISDTTVVLADMSYNLQEQRLATVAAGLLVGRGERVNYFTGLRYIGELDSTIASFVSNYQLTQKYSLNLNLAVDLSATSSRGGSVNLVRRFDRFFVALGGFYDATEDDGGVTVQVYPEGLAGAFGTNFGAR
jgi:hypothetical protein